MTALAISGCTERFEIDRRTVALSAAFGTASIWGVIMKNPVSEVLSDEKPYTHLRAHRSVYRGREGHISVVWYCPMLIVHTLGSTSISERAPP